MPKQSISAFDEILGQFSADEDRQAFTSLTEKNPWLREYGLRQSDYSRAMNENRDALQELQQWRDWREENWDSEAKRTKTEAELSAELEATMLAKLELEKQLAFGEFGGEMNFSEIEADLDKYLSQKGYVSKDVLAAKEQEFRTIQGATSVAALHVPYLNQKHLQEFGELFDPDTFLKEATEKGRYDLKDYYERDFVVSKREAARQAKHDAEIAKLKSEHDAALDKAKVEAEALAQRMQGMGPQGSPTDVDGPQMGSFQKSYLKLDQKQEDSSQAPNVDLGEGGIAAFAARQFREKLAGRG